MLITSTISMPLRKTICVKATRLSYQESNELETTTLFFIHGNSGASDMWQKQIQSPELSHYRLVAFDLPGHGESDPLPTEQYNVLNISDVLATAIRELVQQKPYIIIGFSLGANLAAELLAHDLHPEGLALIGPTVFGNGITLQDALNEKNDPAILFTNGAERDTVENSFRSWCHSKNEPDIQDLTDAYFTTKQPFRSALLQSAQDGLFNDEIALLQRYNKPVLVLFGEEEMFCNPKYLDNAGLPLWNNQVYCIPNGSHFINLDQPEKVTLLLKAYGAYIFTDSHAATQNSAVR